MKADDGGEQDFRADGAAPPNPARAHARDVDLAGGNVIDVRPYLTRVARLRQGPGEDAPASDEGAGPGRDLEAVVAPLCTVIVAGKVLFRAEQLSDLIERLRAERSAAFDLGDHDKA